MSLAVAAARAATAFRGHMKRRAVLRSIGDGDGDSSSSMGDASIDAG